MSKLGEIDSQTLRVPREVYQDYKHWLKEAGGRELPPSLKRFLVMLHQDKFHYTDLQEWSKTLTLSEYSTLYFHGMTPEDKKNADPE